METVEGLIKDSIAGIDHGKYLDKLIDELLKGRINPQAAAQRLVIRLASDLGHVKNNPQ